MSGIVEEFIEFVKINSNSLQERKMADVLAVKLKEIGCEVYEDDAGSKIGGNCGNLCAVLDGGLPGAVLLSAHMDRVPNGEGICPVVGDMCITSDGSTILAADDLAGVCGILDGLRRLKAAGTPFPRVEVVFTVCEEKSVSGSRYLDYGRITAKRGYVFDSPGRIGRVIQSAPSKSRITITVHGKPAHAGNEPEKGVDALKAAANILSTLQTGRIDSETVSNFPIIKTGNTSTNVVCDYVQINGEARSRDHKKLLAYLDYLRKTVSECAEESGVTTQIDTAIDYVCFHIDNDSDTILILEKAFEQMGITMNVTPGGGGMDANRYNEHGISTVGVATGYLRNHTFNEQVYIEDLIRSGELVERVVRLCGQ